MDAGGTDGERGDADQTEADAGGLRIRDPRYAGSATSGCIEPVRGTAIVSTGLFTIEGASTVEIESASVIYDFGMGRRFQVEADLFDPSDNTVVPIARPATFSIPREFEYQAEGILEGDERILQCGWTCDGAAPPVVSLHVRSDGGDLEQVMTQIRIHCQG
ncbi:MAG: hypothetical protein AB7P00_06035 [Sandaracinaceae bacterium]